MIVYVVFFVCSIDIFSDYIGYDYISADNFVIYEDHMMCQAPYKFNNVSVYSKEFDCIFTHVQISCI